MPAAPEQEFLVRLQAAAKHTLYEAKLHIRDIEFLQQRQIFQTDFQNGLKFFAVVVNMLFSMCIGIYVVMVDHMGCQTEKL